MMNFEPCTDRVIFFLVADVTTKWKNLRTQYLKELSQMKKKKASGSGSGTTIEQRKWRFFTHLHFLEPVTANKASRACNLAVCSSYLFVI